MLVHLRKGEGFAELVAGFGVGTATAWRYARETITLLAARAPKLRGALGVAKKAGHAFMVIDGTLIPIDRVAADRPFYSGKHRRHGINLQVISSPAAEILWVSGRLPGAVHDLTAARIWGIIRELEAAGLIVLADKGYIGAGEHVLTRTGAGTSPPRRRPPTPPTPGSARPVSGPTPSSRPGPSCPHCAAAPGAPGRSPKPSTSCRPARPPDEHAHCSAAGPGPAAGCSPRRDCLAVPVGGVAAGTGVISGISRSHTRLGRALYRLSMTWASPPTQ